MAAKEDKYGKIHGKLEGFLTLYLRLYLLIQSFLLSGAGAIPSPSLEILDPAKTLPILFPFVEYLYRRNRVNSQQVVLEKLQQVIEMCIYMIISEWYEEIGKIGFHEDVTTLLQMFLDFQV